MTPAATASARQPWDTGAFRARVQEVLEAFLDEQGRRLEPLGPDAARLLEAARDALGGGKRLRAMFCYWGFRAVRDTEDPDVERAVIRAAGALELLHASALVHDDLMDASDTRRGRPAVHRAFESAHREHRWQGDPAQYGEAGAILLGDLLLSWADELLRGCGLGNGAVLDALAVLDSTRTEVIAGQFLDVSVQARGRSSVEESMRVLRYKSAKYSVERPLHLGAALAGGSVAAREALTSYGLPLGEAFQLRDDLLGVYGDPEVTGKPAGDDLSEGKATVLVALALERASAEDAALLQERLGQDLTPEDVQRLQAVIRRSGASAEVERLIEGLTAEAIRALHAPVLTESARTTLRELAAAATQRTR